MPGAMRSMANTFNVPPEWRADQTLLIHIDKLVLPYHGNGLPGAAMDTNDDTPDLVVVDLSGSEPTYMLTQNLDTLHEGLLMPMPAAANRLAAPLRVESDPPTEVQLNVAQIAIDYRMLQINDEPYVTLTINQIGNTARNDLPGQMVLQVYADNSRFPCFIHRFKSRPTNEFTYNMTVPLSVLSNGRSAEVLKVLVVDEADGNLDPTDIDNVVYIYPEPGSLPDDPGYLNVTAIEALTEVEQNHDAEFSVIVSTNTPSYTCQWQKKENDRWVNLSGETGTVLHLTKCKVKESGSLYRCVVTNTEGRVANSNEVLLIVHPHIPVTGDNTPLLPLTACVLLSLLGCMLLYRRRTARS